MEPVRVAVTGAQGYLGRKVVKCLTRKGIQVVPLGRKVENGMLVCDLSDPDQMQRIFTAVKPDKIIHCAAHVPKTLGEYGDTDSANKSLKMVQYLLNITNCPLIYISSMTVYGTGGNIAKREEEAGDPISSYGIGKWQAEKLIEQSGRPAWAVRIPGLFGEPRSDGIVHNVIRSFRDGAPLSLPHNPMIWAAMRVDDAAEGIALLALEDTDAFQPINVAYRGIYSISRMVSMVAELFNCQSDYTVEHPDFEFDLTLANRLGIASERTLRDVLADLRVLP